MRILFVGMQESIHLVRWVSTVTEQGWDVHLFPVHALAEMHPQLRDVTVHDRFDPLPDDAQERVRVKDCFWPFVPARWPLRRGKYRVWKLLTQRDRRIRDRAWRLAMTIRKLRPDIVHSLEMQHAGYLTLDARRFDGACFPPWVYSSWGSDMFFFRRRPEHLPRIHAVLAQCDYYISDCRRDVALAHELGLKGTSLGVVPPTGGFPLAMMRGLRTPGDVCQRKVIALKGYHDDAWAGRALVALQALAACADLLADYQIEIYLAGDNVRYAAEYVSRVTGLRISIIPQSPVEEIYKLFGRSRLAIGVSVSDGAVCTMLEAAIMGALPIQSDTISTAEWINDGQNGLLVPPEDPAAIARAIRRALVDDDLVRRAEAMNWQLAAERLDRKRIQPQIIALYEHIAAERRAGRCANA